MKKAGNPLVGGEPGLGNQVQTICLGFDVQCEVVDSVLLPAAVAPATAIPAAIRAAFVEITAAPAAAPAPVAAAPAVSACAKTPVENAARIKPKASFFILLPPFQVPPVVPVRIRSQSSFRIRADYAGQMREMASSSWRECRECRKCRECRAPLRCIPASGVPASGVLGFTHNRSLTITGLRP